MCRGSGRSDRCRVACSSAARPWPRRRYGRQRCRELQRRRRRDDERRWSWRQCDDQRWRAQPIRQRAISAVVASAPSIIGSVTDVSTAATSRSASRLSAFTTRTTMMPMHTILAVKSCAYASCDTAGSSIATSSGATRPLGRFPEKTKPRCDAPGLFYAPCRVGRLSRRAPLLAVRVVPGNELALEGLLVTAQRHAHVLPIQFLQLRAAGVRRVCQRRRRCD